MRTEPKSWPRFGALVAGLLLAAAVAAADGLTLPAWVGDHMVLPTDGRAALVGRAEPGAEVTLEFGGFAAAATTDAQGCWTLSLPVLPPGLVGELSLAAGAAKRRFTDVVAGEIWLGAGQSNMVRRVAATAEAAAAVVEIATVDVRAFSEHGWIRITSENIRSQSAVAGYFAIARSRVTGCPVGFYVAARGGTGIEAWLPRDAFPDTPRGRVLRPLVDDPEVLQAASDDEADHREYGQHRLARWQLGRAAPAALFEQLIRPAADLPLTGMIWYQGESNATPSAGAGEYSDWLAGLVRAYRDLWHRPDLPVVVIQLPAYDPGTAELREAWAQVQAAQTAIAGVLERVAVVDIRDLGEADNVHPRRKRGVGMRASAAAENLLGP